VPRSQRGFVFTCVALLGGDVTDAGVPVLDVVPMHESGRLGPGLVHAGQALAWWGTRGGISPCGAPIWRRRCHR
jgi:hypothetical protein